MGLGVRQGHRARGQTGVGVPPPVPEVCGAHPTKLPPLKAALDPPTGTQCPHLGQRGPEGTWDRPQERCSETGAEDAGGRVCPALDWGGGSPGRQRGLVEALTPPHLPQGGTPRPILEMGGEVQRPCQGPSSGLGPALCPVSRHPSSGLSPGASAGFSHGVDAPRTAASQPPAPPLSTSQADLP